MALSTSLRNELDAWVQAHPVVLFMKGDRQQPACGFSAKTVRVLDNLLADYQTVDVLSSRELRDGIKVYSDWPTIPQLYVQGEFVGGCDIVVEMADSGELHRVLGFESPSERAPSIEISAAAAEMFRSATAGSSEQFLCLSISQDFEYELTLGMKAETDFVVHSNGIDLAIDQMSATRADGLKIDYEHEDGVEGFAMRNPNEPPQ